MIEQKRKKSQDTRPGWDEYFLGIINEVAKRATCDRGKAGCVIVKDKRILATGYVGSPAGQPHCDEAGHMMRDVVSPDATMSKHCIRTIHAEQNAICQAARFGIPLTGATLYCKMEPCFTCFPVGEYVYKDFLPINVEEIKVGDKLFSITGKSKVERIFEREYNGKIVILKPRGFFSLKLTPEHPIFVYDGRKMRAKLRVNSLLKCQNKPVKIINLEGKWIDAKDVKAGDYLVLPKIKSNNSYSINFKDYSRYPWSERINERMKKSQNIDRQLSWFLGWYLAEGHACKERRGGVNIYLGKHEKTYIEKLLEISKVRFGCVKMSVRETAAVITVNSAVLARYLRCNFGSTAPQKKIPSWFFELSIDVIHAFLEGYMLGDGALSTTNYGYNYIEISTSSKFLVLQIPLLFAKLGIAPSVYEVKSNSSRIKGRKIKARGKMYSIVVAGSGVKKFFPNARMAKIDKKHYIELEDKLLIPITKIEYEKYRGPVFNFETTDNTYCTPFVVHNCAKMIVNCGIKRVVCAGKYHAAAQSRDLFKKAKVALSVLSNTVVNYKNQK